jgi:hypothetical protein
MSSVLFSVPSTGDRVLLTPPIARRSNQFGFRILPGAVPVVLAAQSAHRPERLVKLRWPEIGGD